MNRKVRLIVTLLMAAIFVISAAACGKTENPKSGEQTPVDYDVAQLAKDIRDNCSFEDAGIAEIDGEHALSLFNISSDLVAADKGSVYSACYIASATPELILCVKAADESSAGRIEEAMKEKISTWIEQYSGYAAAQVPKLESAINRTSGLYIIYAVTNDNVAAAQYIDSIFH